MSTTHLRFKDASWYERLQEEVVLVCGAGGIGSWLTAMLSRLGCDVYLHDFDTVEEHNLGGQLFGRQFVGEPKTTAVYDMTYHLTGNHISTRGIFDENSSVSPFCFSGFDNMAGRKLLFERWAATYGNDPEAIYIDGRLQAEQYQVFCVTKDNIEEYRKYLFDDDKISDGPCSFKQTSHVAAMIAGQMTAFFTNHMANIAEGNKARKVPFFYEYYTALAMVNKNPN